MNRHRNIEGPVEDLKWAEKLKAHVVTPGNRPRIHGYDARGDLLGKLSYPGVIFLTLTGEAPSSEKLAAFENAMVFLAPVSVAEAPVHASVLSGLCGSSTAGMTGVAAIALAEQARRTVSEHSTLFEWLDGRAAEGDAFRTGNEEELADTLFLTGSLRQAGVNVPECWDGLTPVAAGLASLYRYAGLRERWLLEAALVLCRMPCALSEGKAVEAGGFRDYPIDLPRFRYEDDA